MCIYTHIWHRQELSFFLQASPTSTLSAWRLNAIPNRHCYTALVCSLICLFVYLLLFILISSSCLSVCLFSPPLPSMALLAGWEEVRISWRSRSMMLCCGNSDVELLGGRFT